MRHLSLIIFMLLSASIYGQTDWTLQKSVTEQQEEKEQAEQQAKREAKKQAKKQQSLSDKSLQAEQEAQAARENSKYARYLTADCVTTDSTGRVVFTLDMEVKGYSMQQIYDKMREYLNSLARDDKQKERIGILMINDKEHSIVARYDEWLTFTSNFIENDRAEMDYIIIANCEDERLHLTLNHITYTYEEGREGGFKEPANRIITDKYAVNKKHTKLLPIYGKFRRKTIDRVDEVFGQIRQLFK